MPRSKRSRIVHTSRIQKKPSKEKSASLYASVRAAATNYAHILLFSVDNMRNTYLKDVRSHFSPDSRLFFGKTKVMAKALGTTPEEEAMPGLGELGGMLAGNMGVICTDREIEEVVEWLGEFSEVDFARAGTVASRRFVVPAGIVYSMGGEVPEEDDVPVAHSMESTLRGWGMPTRLEKGRVVLGEEYVVCEEGRVLDSNQTALLKCFGVAMAEFRIRVVGYWSAATGEVTAVEGEGENGQGIESMDED